VKTVGKSPSRHGSSPYVRALVWLVLIPMVYAVTIGTVHADAAFQPEYFSSRVRGGSGPTAISVEHPIRRHSHDSGCLLCLLGQQLSSSTLSAAVFVYQPTPPAKVITSQPGLRDAALRLSRTSELSFGRAPPCRQLAKGAGLDE